MKSTKNSKRHREMENYVDFGTPPLAFNPSNNLTKNYSGIFFLFQVCGNAFRCSKAGYA